MSENEIQVEAGLSSVLDIYKSAGILDEMVILENIAFLALDYECKKVTQGMQFAPLRELARHSGQGVLQKLLLTEVTKLFEEYDIFNKEQPTLSLLPSPPEDVIVRRIDELTYILYEMFDRVGDLGKWFDQVLIPRFSSMSKGGRYATPRHLIDFMAGVVNLTPDDTLADFACGTGGMLVDSHSLYPWSTGKVTGIEISPNMARLAFANLVLNQQMKHDLKLGNAFEVFSRLAPDEKFDVVLMNPPWGIKIDPYILEDLFHTNAFFSNFKGTSETMFTALAYEKLKPGGRMSIMVPSGLLFSTGHGEKNLRQFLAQENALQAIINLPQPINNVSTHVLFAVKPEKNNNNQRKGVWFYQPRFDGFTSGKKRQPNTLDDLPLVQTACNARTTSDSINVIPLIEKEKLLGYQISSEDESDFIVNPTGKDLLVEVIQKNEVVEYIHAKGEEVYRGKNSRIPLPKITSKGNSLEGKYVIKTMVEFISDEAPAFSALFEPGKGEIRKGVQNKSRFGIATKDEVHATGILLNKIFQVASNPFPIVLDKSVGDEKPTYFMLFDGDEKEPVGLLVVLYDGLNGIRLQGSDLELFLCDWNKSRGEALFYMPSRSIFLWNNSLSFKEDPNKATVQGEIFRSDSLRRGVMFTIHSQILGIYVSRQEILNTQNAELQPEKYWVEKRQDIVTRSAAQILGDIKKNQNQLTSTLDRLLSISEVQPVAGTELPPQLSLIAPSQELLQGIQQGIWEIVQKQTEQAANYLTPKPFQADDVHSELNENISVMDVQRALELFERMGLIVSVSYEGAPYYRLPEERDVITGNVQ